MAYPFIDKTTQHGFFFASDTCSALGTGAFEAQYIPSVRGTLKWVDSMSGVRSSDWRARIARGSLATTGLSGVRATVEDSTGFLEVKGYINAKTEANKRRYGIVGHIYRPPSISGAVYSPPGQADQDAAGSFISAYARALSGLEAQVATGEGREAIKMITNRATSLYSGVLKVARTLSAIARPAREKSRARRRDRISGRSTGLDPRKTGKALADSYLEAVYGMIPLCNDIRSAHTVLHELRAPFEYVQGRSADNVPFIDTGSNITGFGILDYDTEYRRVDRYSVNYACMARLYYGNVPPASDLVRNAGFTLEAFRPAVWNLLPYSFLVDYFSNMNEVITGYSYYDSLPGTYAKCVVHETKQTWWAGRARIAPGFSVIEPSVISQPSTIVVTTRAIVRGVHSNGLPLPRLRFRFPGLRQGLNIAALIASKALR